MGFAGMFILGMSVAFGSIHPLILCGGGFLGVSIGIVGVVHLSPSQLYE